MGLGIKGLVKSTLARVRGRHVRAATGFQSEILNPFLSLLKQLQFAPAHIIDVGANKGEWTRAVIQFFPQAHYTLVEPQEHLKAHIQDLLDGGHKIDWISAGVADRAGRLTFTIASRDDSSTFALSKEQAEAAGARQVEVEVKTLNQIAASCKSGIPDMVKIDAEGLDLKVLAGASDLIGKTEIFLVEAVVCAPFENSVAEVMRFMNYAGYRLIDITDLNRSPKFGVLWLCEMAFLRNGSSLLAGVTSYE
jgi:FkbM family methyltransferase